MSGEKPEGYPHVRRVGAYLFFGWLAICSAIVVRVLLARIGLSAGSTLLGDIVNYAVIVATFLALRDMTTRHERYPS